LSALALVLLGVAAVAAVTDWGAVAVRSRRVEYVVKPLTTIALLAVAVTIEPRNQTAQVLFVVALVFSLGGDVLLMLPDRRRWFPFGLASFLLAHIAYIPALVLLGASGDGLLAGVVLVVVAIGTFGRMIIGGVRTNQPALIAPVVVYLVVLSAMVVVAWGTLLPLAIAGAVLFFASDAVLAGNEFVRPHRVASVVVMVTYHLAQTLLVLSLVQW
jgi:uncharacterized membrane protein YhhN